MNIPVELVCTFMAGILGLQGWILKEIIALKVKAARVDDLDKRVAKLEAAKA